MSIHAAKVGFWLHRTNTDIGAFVGSGTFVSETHILTAKHVFFAAGGHTRLELWARPASNAAESLKIEAGNVQFHPVLDVALACIASSIDHVAPVALDVRAKNAAEPHGFTVDAHFEGKPQSPEPVTLSAWDDLAQHYTTNVKHPKGNSGGAVCVQGRLWGIVIRQYLDLATIRGCVIAVAQFAPWLRGILPQAAVPVPDAVCPAAYSPVCKTLWAKLFDNEKAGWLSLEGFGLVKLFQSVTIDMATTEPEWLGWPATAQGFCHFCVSGSPSGAALLSCLLEVLILSEQQKSQAPLPQPAKEVLLALVAMAIERWVFDEADIVPLLPPKLDGGIRLELNDPWVAFLIGAAAHKLSVRVDPELTGLPPALIMVKSPIENIYKNTLIPVERALAAALSGADVINPGTAHVKRILRPLKVHLKSDLLLGVRADDAGNPLLNPAVRSELMNSYKLNTIEFGDAPPAPPSDGMPPPEGEAGMPDLPSAGETAGRAAKLRQFATDLRYLVAELNRRLNPKSS